MKKIIIRHHRDYYGKVKYLVASEFESVEQVCDAVLASCFIPVAYEEMIIYKDFGFIVDGCLSAPPLQADIVISPYEEHLPDVCPKESFPTSLVFSLLHKDDVVSLFEKGYLDAVEWINNGCVTREPEREKIFGDTKLGVMALVMVGVRCLLEIAGMDRDRTTRVCQWLGLDDERRYRKSGTSTKKTQ